MIKAMSATAMPEMREGLFYSVANFDKNLLAKLAVYVFTLWQISKRLVTIFHDYRDTSFWPSVTKIPFSKFGFTK